jgi:hypothetical protein
MKQDIFGMVEAAYDLPAQEQAVQPQLKTLLGVVYYRQQVLRNLEEVQCTDGAPERQAYILYFQVPRMHLTPTIFQPVLM